MLRGHNRPIVWRVVIIGRWMMTEDFKWDLEADVVVSGLWRRSADGRHFRA